MKIESSELILNADGSIYHLNLLPEHIAQTVITVGDPNRVEKVARHFDEVEFKLSKREFFTQTGTYKGKRMTVISTGIGPDNIDIVVNELDALVNIDLKTREVKKDLTSLDIVRIGTSGSIQEDIPLDAFVMSELAIGFDGVLQYYQGDKYMHPDFSRAFVEHMDWYNKMSEPYIVEGSKSLAAKLNSDKVHAGFTGTNIGFYGPQGRKLRLDLRDANMNDKLSSFSYKGKRITNLEMETATIFGLSKLLGHRALAMNAIVANRATGQFSKDPGKTVDDLIVYCLDKLAE